MLSFCDEGRDAFLAVLDIVQARLRIHIRDQPLDADSESVLLVELRMADSEFFLMTALRKIAERLFSVVAPRRTDLDSVSVALPRMIDLGSALGVYFSHCP